MNRTIIVVVVALTLLIAGCGGPGDAPDEENNTSDAADEDEGDAEPADEDAENDSADEAIAHVASASVPAIG